MVFRAAADDVTVRKLSVHMPRVLTFSKNLGTMSKLLGRPEGKNHLEDSGVDGRIIVSWIFRKWDIGRDWIELAQDRDRWRARVNAVMNFRVP